MPPKKSNNKKPTLPTKQIPSLGGQANTRKQIKPQLPKLAQPFQRPNLLDVGSISNKTNIQLQMDKSKESLVDSSKPSQKPVVKNTHEKPSPSKSNAPPVNPVELKTGTPISQFQGRTPASSFMTTSFNKTQPKRSNNILSMKGPVYKKGFAGIPRSFLCQQQLQQMSQLSLPSPTNTAGTNNQTDQNYSSGPVWEAVVPKVRTDRWSTVQEPIQIQVEPQPPGALVGSVPQPRPDMLANIYNNMDDNMEQLEQQYSPSDSYADAPIFEDVNDVPDELQDDYQSNSVEAGSKRLSAFKRLGPLTQPKKPKLTINLLLNKEQAVREVVDKTEAVDKSEVVDEDKYTLVHLKPDIQTSVDDTVMKYLVSWPWKKNPAIRRPGILKHYKNVSQLEPEQVEELYDNDKCYYMIQVTGYPAAWNKEDVLDAILEAVKGKSFIPCFIQFTRNECKFLVIRSTSALIAIHNLGYVVRRQEVELTLNIGLTGFSVVQLDFIPRLVLRKRLSLAMEGETELNMKQFTVQNDISYFIYFPLNRLSNQSELMQLQSAVPWGSLTKLVLSHNRMTSLTGFNLAHFTPKLKHLDLSYNELDSASSLLQLRDLPLKSVMLEGNPLCRDFIEQERYITVLRMLFPMLKEIDGVKLTLPGDVPGSIRNYCPHDATRIVEKLLHVMFPLLDSPPNERLLIEGLYDVNAVMTVTFMYKLRYGPIFKDFRPLFARARVMDEGDMESIQGAAAIAKVVSHWPVLHHDPATFTVDVILHTDTTTIIRMNGIVKVTTETLAEDEHLLSFARTIVLHSIDAVEYKITNEMIYWDLPEKDKAKDAFRMTALQANKSNHWSLKLELESQPDEELKHSLLAIFMTLTEMDRKPSEKCMELSEWNLRDALKHFSQLLKLDNLHPLYN